MSDYDDYPCRWRVGDSCTSPKIVTAGRIAVGVCAHCHLRDHPSLTPEDEDKSRREFVARQRQYEMVQALLNKKCVHRGGPTGEVRRYQRCIFQRDVPLMECKIHGTCTIKDHIPPIKLCLDCKEREEN